MAKSKTVYICQNCGARRPKWEGKCSDCHQWNTLVEEVQKAAPSGKKKGWAIDGDNPTLSTVSLDQKITQTQELRINTHHQELNRVLGGGLIKGSFTLVGGDPGIGKSTLLLQMAGGLAKSKVKTLYISAEESVQQTALRAQRLGVHSPLVEVAAESSLENIIELTNIRQPQVLIVDSIQTVYSAEIQSAPGTVSQVRDCAAHLMSLAKSQGIAVFIVGHVTKDGHIAGPKVLEHMVDTVLSFEGDTNHQFRILRSVKNRFGAANELGVFQMASEGLQEVENPSEFFLEERGSALIGSSIFAAMEGTRPLLCEVQALSVQTPLAMPRRTSLGFDPNRVHLLVAVMDRYLGLELFKNDIFINIVGGLKVTEPAADLSVAASIISSNRTIEIDPKTCFIGEVGLTGEVRAASFIEQRIKEALKLGFKSFYLPYSNKKHLKGFDQKAQFYWLKSIDELSRLLEKNQRPLSSKTSYDSSSLEEELFS
ncbi:MAG: DNA repair protein RadA [Bdellovibrionales bacterium]|nr:DNA repair protein RadA [Bdellovibrionales bacterium]